MPVQIDAIRVRGSSRLSAVAAASSCGVRAIASTAGGTITVSARRSALRSCRTSIVKSAAVGREPRLGGARDDLVQRLSVQTLRGSEDPRRDAQLERVCAGEGEDDDAVPAVAHGQIFAHLGNQATSGFRRRGR